MGFFQNVWFGFIVGFIVFAVVLYRAVLSLSSIKQACQEKENKYPTCGV